MCFKVTSEAGVRTTRYTWQVRQYFYSTEETIPACYCCSIVADLQSHDTQDMKYCLIYCIIHIGDIINLTVN